eukprot:2864777-Amphidinium_carterae.1
MQHSQHQQQQLLQQLLSEKNSRATSTNELPEPPKELDLSNSLYGDSDDDFQLVMGSRAKRKLRSLQRNTLPPPNSCTDHTALPPPIGDFKPPNNVTPERTWAQVFADAGQADGIDGEGAVAATSTPSLPIPPVPAA